MNLLPPMAPARAPEQIIAHHGCPRSVAERIVGGQGFVPSANTYDWLGFGVYFWEYAPDRALQWARRRSKGAVAVVEATLTLGRCLNLLDTAHFDGMRQSYQLSVAGLREAGLPAPDNKYPFHNLDCLVVDSYCLDYAMIEEVELQTVRGCFPEGEALFKGSKILDLTHIQIAVRDTACISDVRMLDLG